MKLVIKVLHKPTKEKRLIVLDRFNPGLHEKITGEKPYPIEEPESTGKVVIGTPKLDPIESAVKRGEEKKLAKEEKKEENSKWQEPLTISELESLKTFELKAYSRVRGFKPQNTTTKKEVLAWLLSNNGIKTE